MKRSTLGPAVVRSLVREVRRGSGDPRPLAVAGARELVPILASSCARVVSRRGVEGPLEDAGGCIWIGAPDEDGCARRRAGVPIIAVTDAREVPYVLGDGPRARPARGGLPGRGDRAAVARASVRTAPRSPRGCPSCAARLRGADRGRSRSRTR